MPWNHCCSALTILVTGEPGGLDPAQIKMSLKKTWIKLHAATQTAKYCAENQASDFNIHVRIVALCSMI